MLGLRETASTFFFMDEGANSGDILSQQSLEISVADDATSLYERITKIALGQIRGFVRRLADGTYQRKTQVEKQSYVWRKRGARQMDVLIGVWQQQRVTIL